MKVTLLCCAALFVWAFASSAPAQARPALGVNIQNPFDPVQVANVEALHPESVRAFVQARNLQSPYGELRPDLAKAYQDFVARMNGDGIPVDFAVLSAPGGTGMNSTSADPGVFADFMTKFAALFKGTGTSYELWNEPDEDRFWTPQPSQDAYAALVKAAYPAIKRVDPAATVVLGPTTGNNYDFIEDLYQRGIKGYFDAVAVHTDTACSVAAPTSFYREANRIGRYSFLGYKEVHATMLANGDNKPIWMTEFGWSSTNGGPTSCANGMWAGKKPSGVSEAQQAAFLTGAVRCMSQDSYLTSASWFIIRDDPGSFSDETRSYGLVRGDGSFKPAYHQLEGLLRGTISPVGKCADLKGPRVRVLSPKRGQRHGNGPLRIRIRATDPSGIKSIRFYSGNTKFATLNKSRVLNRRRPASYAWRGVKCEQRGRVRISVDVLDKLGNKTTARIVFKKTAKPKGRSCRRATKRG